MSGVSFGADVEAGELRSLFVQTDWAADRSADGIARMLAVSPVRIVARLGDGRLIGFGRAITDGLYRALLEDIVVDAAWRGRGVGREVVRRLEGQLDRVEWVYLMCAPENVPFYKVLGYGRDDGPVLRKRGGG